MNWFLALIGYILEFGAEGLPWAINAGMSAALFTGAVLLVDLVPRKWLTAGQRNLLWGLVLSRLLMPMAPVSYLSLQNLSLPAATGSTPNEPADWFPAVDDAESSAESPGPYSAAEPAPEIDSAAEWENCLGQLLTLAWLAGVLFVLVWTPIVHLRFSGACGVRRFATTRGSSHCGKLAAAKRVCDERFRSCSATRSDNRR